MMTCRPAIPSDAPALGQILSDWIDETPWMPRLHTREQDSAFVADMVRGGGVDTLLVEERPVGFLQETACHISALYLAEDVRGQGGGTMLIDAAKSRCEHLDLWTFAANEDARRFYRRLGFVETSYSTDNDEGLPDVRLVWERHVA